MDYQIVPVFLDIAVDLKLIIFESIGLIHSFPFVNFKNLIGKVGIDRILASLIHNEFNQTTQLLTYLFKIQQISAIPELFRPYRLD
ncbi:hypothetical protein D3C81_1631780 [compost metagenome]